MALGSDVSGTLPVVNGGTGGGVPSQARASLGAAASGLNSDITSLSGLTTPLSMEQGGTGSGTKNFVDLFSDQTIGGSKVFNPTNDVPGIIVRQATTDSPTNDIFAVQDRTGTTNFLRVDANGEFSWSGTVPDARLSTNVALLNSSPTFSGNVTILGDLAAARLNVGLNNFLASLYATIGGGSDNFIGTGDYGTISGGKGNTLGPIPGSQHTASFSAIGGGVSNSVNTANRGTIAGGEGNRIVGDSVVFPSNGGTIGGGIGNHLDNASYATIGGGWSNRVESAGTGSTIAGGLYNVMQHGPFGSAFICAIGGGQGNFIETGANAATIAGGANNKVGVYCSGGAIGGGSWQRSERRLQDDCWGGRQLCHQSQFCGWPESQGSSHRLFCLG